MRDRFGLMFVVLMICGTSLILGALIVLGLLFNRHAPAMAVMQQYQKFPLYAFLFFVFVVVPSLIAIFAGIWMAITGIRVGQKDTATSPQVS